MNNSILSKFFLHEPITTINNTLSKSIQVFFLKKKNTFSEYPNQYSSSYIEMIHEIKSKERAHIPLEVTNITAQSMRIGIRIYKPILGDNL